MSKMKAVPTFCCNVKEITNILSIYMGEYSVHPVATDAHLLLNVNVAWGIKVGTYHDPSMSKTIMKIVSDISLII